MVRIAIIIVNWNTSDLLKKCLNSIKKYAIEYMSDVYVVDNNSSDDSAKMVKKDFPWVRLTINKGNLGFAKANNQILKKVRDTFVFLLNPDTEIRKNTLSSLIDVIERDSRIAVCGSKMLNQDGTPQYLGFYRKKPSILQGLLFYTDLYRLSIKSKFLVRHFWESNIESCDAIEVEQIPGACIFARREILGKVGFFDERYPIWFEDVDLCYRLRKAGYKLMYVPDSEISHLGGAAFDKWEDRGSKETRFWISLFTYFEKNASYLDKMIMETIIISNLIFLVISRSIMQIFMSNVERGKFIKLKINVISNLLKQ